MEELTIDTTKLYKEIRKAFKGVIHDSFWEDYEYEGQHILQAEINTKTSKLRVVFSIGRWGKAGGYKIERTPDRKGYGLELVDSHKIVFHTFDPKELVALYLKWADVVVKLHDKYTDAFEDALRGVE